MAAGDDEYKSEYARRIREARRRMSMTQTEFAELLGVSMRAVQTWEQGLHLPQPKLRRRIERLLDKDAA